MPADTSQPAVLLDRVSRVYGTFAALRNVSAAIPAGSSVVIRGENGAGKSTLLRLIAGLISPTHGSVRVLGGSPREQAARLAYMSHEPMLYDELTGLENLRYFAALQPMGLSPEEALRTVGLDPALTRRLSEYSQGMRQRASLARVLMSQPEVLLLDEPFSNLDAPSAAQMVGLLGQYVQTASADGKARTLILTTHQFELARPLARSIITLQAGRLLAEAA